MPNQPLEQTVQERARRVAAEHLLPIEHTMLLENQSLPPADRQAQLDAYIHGDWIRDCYGMKPDTGGVTGHLEADDAALLSGDAG